MSDWQKRRGQGRDPRVSSATCSTGDDFFVVLEPQRICGKVAAAGPNMSMRREVESWLSFQGFLAVSCSIVKPSIVDIKVVR